MKNIFAFCFLLFSAFAWAGGPANQHTIVLAQLQWDEVKKMSAMEPQVTHLVIEGPGDHNDVKRIFQLFEASTALFSIELRNVPMDALPHTIKRIPQLSMLRISGYGTYDVVKTLAIIDELPNLRSLELDVISLNELPDELFQLEQIDRLVLHEYLPDGASVAAECIALEADMLEDDRLVKTIQAYVYVSQSTWDKMQQVDAIGQMRIVKACKPVVHRYNHVDPPIALQDVTYTTTTIAAQSGGVMVNPNSNSIVRIPADAFVDAEGQKVTGEVVVSYREFMNPAEFIVSGIPMSYTENGETNYFESAGMVEINAAADGKEVFLAEGKTIDVLLNATEDKGTFDVWNFDDGSGTWTDVGESQPAAVSDINGFIALTQAEFYVMNNSNRKVKAIDATSFENRFRSPWYSNSIAERRSNWTMLSDSRKAMRKNARMHKSWISIHDVHQEGGDVYFRLRGNRFLHPELRYLRTTNFRVDEETSKRLFRKHWGGLSRYSDMRIVERDGQTVLILKDHNGIREVEVTGVERYKQGDDWFYEKAIWPQRTYNKSLNRRRARFDASVMRKFKRNNKRQQILEGRLQRQTQKLMTAEERAMDWETFLTNARAKTNAYNAQREQLNAINTDVQRILSVNNLGLCNIDRLQRMPETDMIAVEFLVDSMPVLVDRIYVCLDNANSVLSNTVDRTRVAQTVMYMGSMTSSIVFITADLRMGIISGEQFQKAVESRKGIVQIASQIIPKDADLKKYKL